MPNLLICGAFAGSYSLAQVNRGLALGVAAELREQGSDWKVYLSAPRESVGEYQVTELLRQFPELQGIFCEFDDLPEIDVTILNNFPKDQQATLGLADLPGKAKAVYLAWEESRYPERWVEEVNREAAAVFCASIHTQKVLERSGVVVPLPVLPNALLESFWKAVADLGSSAKPARKWLKSQKSKVFLHNSSGFGRKGAAELLAAYGQTFSATDDVVLLIKSFPNPHNEFPTLVAELQAQPDSPAVELLMDDNLTTAEMVELYNSADAYVTLAKAEGFNLPVLEAMALGLPVITTAWSGQQDFCNADNSYLVDYELVPAKSHLDNPGAFWAQPDVDHAARLLRDVYVGLDDAEQRSLWRQTGQLTASAYHWQAMAARLLTAVPELLARAQTRTRKLGVISTYNCVCGIAEYSSYLYANMGGSFELVNFLANIDGVGLLEVDDARVKRLWSYGEDDFANLLGWVDEHHYDVIHIQYHVGFYSLDALAGLITALSERNIPVVLTSHSFRTPGAELGQIKDALALCSQIHVLNQVDLDYLEELGLQNGSYFPHGNALFPGQSRQRIKKVLGLPEAQPLIATHGFLVEKKGVFETLGALAQALPNLPKLHWLALNAVNPRNLESQSLAEKLQQLLLQSSLHEQTTLVTEFMDRREILLALTAADLAVFAYDESTETNSGAVRLALAAQVPLLVSPSNQLRDLHEVGFLLADNRPETIAAAVQQLANDPSARLEIQRRCYWYQLGGDWQRLALSYVGLLAVLPQRGQSATLAAKE